MTLTGYIVIPRWEEFQHRDALRSGPPMKWHKAYTSQLDDDAYRLLSHAERGVLHDLRMLTARVGQGRVSVQPAVLVQLIGGRGANVMRHVERLYDAGFLQLSASKLPAACQHPASTEEREKRREGSQPPLFSERMDQDRARAPDAGTADAAGAAANGRREELTDDEIARRWPRVEPDTDDTREESI